MQIVQEPEWESLFQDIKKTRGTSIIIGATDSGKSTLAKYLLTRFIQDNIKTCLVDSDVGQSSLGLPGTISMKVFKNKKSLDDYSFERMVFIGTVNPAKKIPFIIETTKKLTEFCKTRSNVILVDTSGLVSGELGITLKVGKIRVIKPIHVIALERKCEMEEVLEFLENVFIHRISVSPLARSRTRESRIQYRKMKFEKYFEATKVSEYVVFPAKLNFYCNNRPLDFRYASFKRGTLIGLNHNDYKGETIALGMVTEMDRDSLSFISPIKSLKQIDAIVFADIVINSNHLKG